MKRYIAILCCSRASPQRARAGISDQRRLAIFLQVGENLRQRPPRHPAPQLEHRPAGSGLLARNHGQLPERHVHSRRMGLEAPVREVLRQSVADLFVNGNYVGTHRGGATAFTFEITDKVGSNRQRHARGGQQQLPRRRASDLDRREPLRRHLPRSEMILTERTAISPLYLGSEEGVLVRQQSVTPEKAEGEVEVHITSKGDNPCMLNVAITGPDGTRTSPSASGQTRRQTRRRTLHHRESRALEPRPAALYTVTTTIGDEAVTDSVTVRTGFRTIAASTADGLTINGVRVPVHGVALTRQCPFGRHADPAGLRRRPASDPHARSQCPAFGGHAPCAVSLRPLRRTGMLVVDTPLHRSSFWATWLTTPCRLSSRTAWSRSGRSSPRTSTTPRW